MKFAHRQAERRLIGNLDHVARARRLARGRAPPWRACCASRPTITAPARRSSTRSTTTTRSASWPSTTRRSTRSSVILEDVVYRQAAAASARALAQSAALRRDEARATGRSLAVAVGLVLLAFFGAIVVRYGRRLDAARAAEVGRLAEMAITDPLTGLRNHRAFQEDVARELQVVARTGVPLALVLSTSTTSRRSTTRTATRPATSACRPWPTRSAPRGAGPTSPTAWAATSSRSSCPTRAPGARSSSLSACARRRRPATPPSPPPPASPRRSGCAPRTS